MSTKRYKSADLLEYDTRNRVLICRECQYAIQKSALGSHLLRHKIYRGEREALLKSVAQLDLLEPDQVLPPTRDSSPIKSLSLIQGLRCTIAGCGNLCASTKRMQRHWSEVHGDQLRPDVSALARPVILQTFFRGTKVRYFEVNYTPRSDSDAFKETANEVTGNAELRSDAQGVQAGEPDSSAQISSPIPARCGHSASEITAQPSLANFDLQALTYFHHFIASTSFTLPDPKQAQPATSNWQTNFVCQALNSKTLMCGLMAISSCHTAALVDDALMKKIHYEHSFQFFSEFSATMHAESTSCTGIRNSKYDETVTEKPSRKLLSLLHCAYWSLSGSGLNLSTVPTFDLQCLIATLRSFRVPGFTFNKDTIKVVDDDGGDIFSQAKQILGTPGMPSPKEGEDSSASPTFTHILDLLSGLPPRIAEAFPETPNGADFLATLSAIAALIKCCNISYSSEDRGEIWSGMMMWLMKIPGHFNAMIEDYHPPALLVVAHWVAFLLRRAQHYGFWFLSGLTERILFQIAQRIPVMNTAAYSILESLRF